jgi:hypothetical protein
MGSDELNEARKKAEQSAVAWFVVLDRARESGDFARAAEAKRQLERLGVDVRYRPAGKAVRDAR